MSLVFLAVDWQAARPQASLYLVLKARPRTIAENPVRAGSQGKHLADHVDGLAKSVRRTEGPEISAAILHDPPRDRDPRPRMIGDLGAQVGFVILQPDVVTRFVLLDEVVSRISASFSLAVTRVSKSRTRRIRKRTWKRPSP